MAEQADWNARLEPIAPLVEYYAREMGQLAGRLLAALSLLVDLEDSHGWDGQGDQTRQTVHYSRLLVASVLRIVAAAQSEQDDATGLAEAIGRWLERLAGGQNGGATPGGRQP